MGKHRAPKIPPEERAYEFGYQKPNPKHGFKKGKIANPKGRPRKVGFNDQFDKILNRRITAGDGSRITVFEGCIQAQAVKALKGDTRAMSFIWQLREKLSNADPRRQAESFDEDDRRILEQYLKGYRQDGEDAA